MNAVITIGIDIAKSAFQIHAVDAAGEPVIRRQLRRRHRHQVRRRHHVRRLPDRRELRRRRHALRPAGRPARTTCTSTNFRCVFEKKSAGRAPEVAVFPRKYLKAI